MINTHPVISFEMLYNRGTESTATTIDDNLSGRHDSPDSVMLRADSDTTSFGELHLLTVVCRESLPDTPTTTF